MNTDNKMKHYTDEVNLIMKICRQQLIQKKRGKVVEMFIFDHDMHQALSELMILK